MVVKCNFNVLIHHQPDFHEPHMLEERGYLPEEHDFMPEERGYMLEEHGSKPDAAIIFQWVVNAIRSDQ
jgi:hypothetical protein